MPGAQRSQRFDRQQAILLQNSTEAVTHFHEAGV